MRSDARLICLAVLCAAATLRAGDIDDLLFHSQRFYSDPRTAGLAGSGAALPSGIFSAYLNPALPESYAKENNLKGLLSAVSYGQQDPLYTGHIVTVGAGYYSKATGAVVNSERYLQGASDQHEYQAMVTYAAQLFEKSGDGQGAVDVGANIHYDKVSWVTRGFDPLYTRVTIPGVPGVRGDTTLLPYGSVDEGYVEDKRLLMDIGFYQANVLNNLDFGLVLHNIFGYSWGRERPWVEGHRKMDPTHLYSNSIPTRSDSVWIDSVHSEYINTDGWMDGYYRRLTIGGAFHSNIVKGKVDLVIPADLEFLGLFDQSDPRNTAVMFRCGIEANIVDRVALRFGYGREPYRVERGTTPTNRNVFTGGAGFHYKGIGADAYIATSGWGAGASLNF